MPGSTPTPRRSDDERTRRTVLRSATVGLGLVGLTAPVQGRSAKGSGNGNGKNGGKTPLVDGPAEFRVYVGTADDTAEDPADPGEFDYPRRPTLAGEDPAGGLFDASEMEKTPNGKTLHHTLEFFQGFLVEKNRGKPYVLVHDEDGRFTERGQQMNFDARTGAALRARLEAAKLNPNLADREPLATLSGGTWRAVGNDVVQFVGDPANSRRIRWSVTRIDFYRKDGGPPEYELSALYVIYPNVDEEGRPTPADPADPTLRPIPTAAREAGRTLITDGRANPGGQ